MQFERAREKGKETSVPETAVQLRDTERACSRAAGAAFRGAQLEPGSPGAHERRPTGHDAMCAASPDHTYHLFIYVYLTDLLLAELSLLHALRVVNNRRTGAPRPRVREKSPASPNKSRGDRSENPPPACPAVASYGNFVSIYDCGTWNRRADDSWMCGRIRFKCMQMRALQGINPGTNSES